MNTLTNNLFPAPTPGATDERLTVSTAVVQLANIATWARETKYIVLDVQLADVMATFDGSNPSSTNGHKLTQGTRVEWGRALAAAAKFIRFAGTDAAIHASEFTV